MALVTLCPGCGTTYKIYPEQLQAQNGLVRCGSCQIIFNGFATLITIDESEIECPNTSTEKMDSSDEPDNVKESFTRFQSVIHNTGIYSDSALSYLQAQVGTEGAAGPVEQEQAEFAGAAEELMAKESEVQASDFLPELNPVKSRQHWLWFLGNVVLLLLLVGQIFHFYRTDLTVLFPQARPYLERFCALLNCSVPLPENIQLISIVSSELEVGEPEHQPDMATLTAIIRNHAAYAQRLPALKLFLTDIHDELLASRIFTAADYLSKENENKTAVESGQEIIIRLYLDYDRLKPSGYRLQLLYL